MNALRKKSAVSKFAGLIESGATREEVMAQLSADEKQYSAEEINEITAALFNDPTGPGTGDTQPPPKPQPKEGKETVNKVYEEYTVDPKYQDVTDPLGKVIGRKLSGFDKLKKLRETSISEERANLLNSQSENTKVRLFLKS